MWTRALRPLLRPENLVCILNLCVAAYHHPHTLRGPWKLCLLTEGPTTTWSLCCGCQETNKTREQFSREAVTKRPIKEQRGWARQHECESKAPSELSQRTADATITSDTGDATVKSAALPSIVGQYCRLMAAEMSIQRWGGGVRWSEADLFRRLGQTRRAASGSTRLLIRTLWSKALRSPCRPSPSSQAEVPVGLPGRPAVLRRSAVRCLRWRWPHCSDHRMEHFHERGTAGGCRRGSRPGHWGYLYTAKVRGRGYALRFLGNTTSTTGTRRHQQRTETQFMMNACGLNRE